mgnify:CR=1 FL=1
MAELEEKGIITTPPVDEFEDWDAGEIPWWRSQPKDPSEFMDIRPAPYNPDASKNIDDYMDKRPATFDPDSSKNIWDHIKPMGINLSPKGVNIGFPTQQKAVGQAEGEGFDEMTKEFIQMHRIGSKMEDDTENALNMIEKMREDTVRKAEK